VTRDLSVAYMKCAGRERRPTAFARRPARHLTATEWIYGDR
jgi:hypothetical protein